MVPSSTPINEAIHEFASSANVRLDKDGLDEFGFIFARTVESFMARADQVDAWTIPRFRGFILGRIREIAIEAERDPAAMPDPTHGNRKLITAEILSNVAVNVMRAAEQRCHMVIVNGRISKIPGVEEGDVCNEFLKTQR